MSWFFLSLVILGFHLVCASDGVNRVPNSPSLWWTTKYTVHIISRLPTVTDYSKNTPPLTVWCQSKNDDLGIHTIYQDQEINWSFKPNLFLTTLFFCHFYWADDDTSFTVYDNRLSGHCKFMANSFNCFWEVRMNGFFLSGDNKSWKKINDWPST